MIKFKEIQLGPNEFMVSVSLTSPYVSPATGRSRKIAIKKLKTKLKNEYIKGLKRMHRIKISMMLVDQYE
jgi:hypothetical protein